MSSTETLDFELYWREKFCCEVIVIVIFVSTGMFAPMLDHLNLLLPMSVEKDIGLF